MAKVTNVQQLFVKSETTRNFDAGHSAGDWIETTEGGAVFQMNPEFYERNPPSVDLGRSPPTYIGGDVTITFSTEVRGSGTAGTAPREAALYRASQLSETIVPGTSVTYKDSADSDNDLVPCTVTFYMDGIKRKATGCIATWALSPSQVGIINWTLTGRLVEQGTATGGDTTTAILAATSCPQDDAYVGQEIVNKTTCENAVITDYDAGTFTVTFSPAMTTGFSNGDLYYIHNDEVETTQYSLTEPTGTPYSVTPPAFRGVPITMGVFSAAGSKTGSTAIDVDTVSVNYNNEISRSTSIRYADGKGDAEIRNRSITASIAPEKLPINSRDWIKELRKSQLTDIDTGTIGCQAGNKWQLKMGLLFQTNGNNADREGLVVYQVELESSKDAATGEQLQLIFT